MMDEHGFEYDPKELQSFRSDVLKTEEERKNEIFGIVDPTKVSMSESLCTYDRLITDSPLITYNEPSYKPWEPSIEDLTIKPTIEEELSKIQEELSNLTQTNNELRKERKVLEKENMEQKEEIEKLKTKLKKERTRGKTIKKTHESELEEIQEDMNYFQDELNKVKDVVDFKRYYK